MELLAPLWFAVSSIAWLLSFLHFLFLQPAITSIAVLSHGLMMPVKTTMRIFGFTPVSFDGDSWDLIKALYLFINVSIIFGIVLGLFAGLLMVATRLVLNFKNIPLIPVRKTVYAILDAVGVISIVKVVVRWFHDEEKKVEHGVQKFGLESFIIERRSQISVPGPMPAKSSTKMMDNEDVIYEDDDGYSYRYDDTVLSVPETLFTKISEDTQATSDDMDEKSSLGGIPEEDEDES
ncbi:unnamed protein product [Kuraishia capsulata CBS 1993]|uniref:Uncharacterized protein n=1 Tax=Kuraishia capsulata CBS 1993 TaxID=1382522 RepID=W6MTD2_9ASCO|nr:uncharacterized protein KUCA_T00004440001 [Kuraishia capsulata CBS 1993]CDK28457.1 unnamed protein product [Kuraishia capsulata CBS 1993]